MKIIDVLDKMANGEELPKIIHHQYYEYKYNKIDNDYQRSDGQMLIGNMNIQYHLNDEIEIIEEQEMCAKCGKYPAEVEGFSTLCEYCLGISEEQEEFENIHELSAGVELEFNEHSIEYKVNQLIRNQKKLVNKYIADKEK